MATIVQTSKRVIAGLGIAGLLTLAAQGAVTHYRPAPQVVSDHMASVQLSLIRAELSLIRSQLAQQEVAK
jgi:hypothetical protein